MAVLLATFLFTSLLSPTHSRKTMGFEVQQMWVQILAQWFKIYTLKSKFSISLSPGFPPGIGITNTISHREPVEDGMRGCEGKSSLSRASDRGTAFLPTHILYSLFRQLTWSPSPLGFSSLTAFTFSWTLPALSVSRPFLILIWDYCGNYQS